ncbi:MAG: chromate transporter [Erysipelotrichaceae bacterium]|nr:chromate transporter [Erysipelotrichaceae bacterium]
MKLILTMIYEFFKAGLFAVGGGLATIPFLKEMSDKYGWFTQELLGTMIAVSESTPGPMGVNMATYVGYTTLHSYIGGIVTTLSLVAPSVIVICIVARMFEKFKQSKLVQNVFYGLRPAVVGFVVVACSGLFVSTLLDVPAKTIKVIPCVLYIVLYLVFTKVKIKEKKISPIPVIIISAILGILLKL